MQTIAEVITYLKVHAAEINIELKPGVRTEFIQRFEETYSIKLPDDIRIFYEYTNGLGHNDEFNIVALEDLVERDGPETKLLIAECYIYCDSWELEVDPQDHNNYKIINGDWGLFKPITVTNSFTEFLRMIVAGGAFGKGGLYDRYDELILEKITNPEAKTAKFKITEDIILPTKREMGLFVFGEVIDGTISAGDVIYIKIQGQMRVIHIRKLADLRATSQKVIALDLALSNRECDHEIKKLTGSTLNIYHFN